MQIKICGITHPEDALLAAQAGVDFIGLIFSSQSKRSITIAKAMEVSAAIKYTKTILTGIFVDESLQDIIRICDVLALNSIQLHGDRSRAALASLLHMHTIFYAMTPDDMNNKNIENLPIHAIPLIDHPSAGSGKTLAWNTLTPPKRCWALAGGLNQDNIDTAISLLNPDIVDVASGVEYRDNIRKDPNKLHQFIRAAKIRRSIFT